VRRRFLAASITLTLVVLAALEIPLAITYQTRSTEHLESALTRDAFFIASLVEDQLEGTSDLDLQRVADEYAARTGARVVIVDADGMSRADSDPPRPGSRSFADRPELAEALQRRVAIGSRRSETLDTDLLYVAVPVFSGGELHGAVRLSYTTEQLEQKVHQYWLMLAGIAAVSLLAASGVAILLTRWIASPIEHLRTAATTLGSGDLSVRANPDAGPPEVQELARAFNRTAARLQELVTAQEQFVADASHQLRTPLTALRLRLEMITDEIEASEGHAGLADDLEAARTEVLRLSRLVDGLLALARAERSDASRTASRVQLDAVFNDRRAVWEPLAADRDVRIEVDAAGLSALATPDRLSQVLDNLLANALEHAPAGTAVELRAELDNSASRTLAVHVRDHGPGMSPEQRARAFDRFWRASSTRSELGGSGLGLSIVQKLVLADGGEVALDETPGGGLDVIVRLPRADREHRESAHS